MVGDLSDDGGSAEQSCDEAEVSVKDDMQTLVGDAGSAGQPIEEAEAVEGDLALASRSASLVEKPSLSDDEGAQEAEVVNLFYERDSSDAVRALAIEAQRIRERMMVAACFAPWRKLTMVMSQATDFARRGCPEAAHSW